GSLPLQARAHDGCRRCAVRAGKHQKPASNGCECALAEASSSRTRPEWRQELSSTIAQCLDRKSAVIDCAFHGFADANVRFGSKADITRHLANVHFTPKSGQEQTRRYVRFERALHDAFAGLAGAGKLGATSASPSITFAASPARAS